jgi:xanthine dehydrogenase/oxidase
MVDSQRHEVSFFLNGESVTIENPPPDMLLIDYLRSPDVALTGAKKPCGQGGCGGCTVILSRWDEELGEPVRGTRLVVQSLCGLGLVGRGPL